jgi:hypothetical protein
MIIANPIYDVVFKRLMENEKVAKFFIGTLLDTQIEALEVKPQEFTFIKDLDQDDPQVQQYINQRIRERLIINVLRLDFVATIRTADGSLKKVLIEIQKAKNEVDLMRFRNYLAEQYKKEDKVDGERHVLPITTIYILGFNLPDIDTPCILVKREYIDLINHRLITKKSDFVEKLTHDSYIVQVGRITDRYQTRLDKLLSVFEQRNFTDDREITKNFAHAPDLEELKAMTDILHHVGTDPEERKQIEIEQEAWRSVNAMFAERERRYQQQLADHQKALEDQQKALEDQQKVVDDQQKALEDQQKVVDDQQKALEDQQKILDEKDKLIAELMKKMGGAG